MSPTRTQVVACFDWQGITIEVVYEPNWLNLANRHGSLPSAHLDIRSIAPERAPLPITETGYRSHFLHSEEIEVAGGPAAYVETWLNVMAESAEWQAHEVSSRQLSLF